MVQQENTFNYGGNSYLISLITMHPETFRMHGIRGFIDDQSFRCGAGIYLQ